MPSTLNILQLVKAKHFELVGSQIELTNHLAPYGSLEYGHLTIRCRLKRGKWIHRQDKWGHRWDRLEMYPSTAEDDSTNEFDGSRLRKGMHPHYRFDAIEDEFNDEDDTTIPVPVYMLEVGFQGGQITSNGVHGLILRKLGDSQFSRLGVFALGGSLEKISWETEEEFEQRMEFQSHWLDGCEPQVRVILGARFPTSTIS
jgi:hypothetical protein